MEIRSATQRDIPQIVDLLKKSLGEGLMPKSESFWIWKHVENPFGTSPVLLAVEGKEVIGVRAFMRWEWKWKTTTWTAVRAVDTATHPAYQGKGIFTKLTLALVKQCKLEGTHFVFNTPNTQSHPGYLKMGWRDAGRMKLSINPRISFGRSSAFDEAAYDPELYLNDPRLTELMEDDRKRTRAKMCTNRSPAYLKWRYLSNPNIRYFAVGAFSGSSSFLFICRVKDRKYGRELRVCDALCASSAVKKDMRNVLGALINDVKPLLVTFSEYGYFLPLLTLALPAGPRVTVMDLNGEVSRETGTNFAHWAPSLGDMEVF